jgi:hypothetical protein
MPSESAGQKSSLFGFPNRSVEGPLFSVGSVTKYSVEKVDVVLPLKSKRDGHP